MTAPEVRIPPTEAIELLRPVLERARACEEHAKDYLITNENGHLMDHARVVNNELDQYLRGLTAPLSAAEHPTARHVKRSSLALHVRRPRAAWRETFAVLYGGNEVPACARQLEVVTAAAEVNLLLKSA